MRYIPTILMLLLCLYCVNVAVKESIRGIKYERAYEASRAELEAFMRTKGRHINSAFVCKSK